MHWPMVRAERPNSSLLYDWWLVAKNGENSGGPKGRIKLGGSKDPYCRFYHTWAYFLYPTYVHPTFL